MSKTYYACHPSGNDLNGGGYYDDDVTVPDWADWHDEFDAVASQSGCAISNVTGSVRIAVTGAFTSDLLNTLVNCVFSGTYDNGRYPITDAGTNYIEIPVAYSSDVPTVTVYIGGAIKSPDEACALAYGTSGYVLLLPANQTNQTVNEVMDEGNRIICSTEGSTLEMYSVDDSTGVKLTTKDSTKWPVIKASGTWTTSGLAMLLFDSTQNYSKIDKIVLDGNSVSPRVVQLGSDAADRTYLQWGDVQIINSKSDGTGLYVLAYLNTIYGRAGYYIYNLKISDCYNGVYTGTRYWPAINTLWIDGCTNYGLEFNQTPTPSFFILQIENLVITNNAIGLRKYRYDMDLYCKSTFANNTIDIQLNKYSTTSFNHIIINALFYNDSDSGANIYVDDNNYITVELKNCVYGATGSGGTAFNGITPTLTNCQEITADPFVDKANGDYRLNPAFADLAKIWDWDSMTNIIGATTPAKPAAGGGGGVSQLINGGFIK